MKFGGGFYKDDGPGDRPPDIDAIPDAVPRAEPLHRFANNPYSVLGRDYVPRASTSPMRGAASAVLVWKAQVPRAEDLQRRDLRHVRR
jgi:hypothetical protein